MSAASLRRKEVESTPSRVAASTLVKFAPEPENEVAVTTPAALIPPAVILTSSLNVEIPATTRSNVDT